MSYTPPAFDATSFHCPHCNVFAHQHKSRFYDQTFDYAYSQCEHCQNLAIWIEQKMVYPLTGNAPPPNRDMSKEIIEIYEEARQIMTLSPRASAGLLRLCIEKLMNVLGETEGKLNTRIGNLVKKGLPPEIQQALDIVRVTGNEELHMGQIDLNDNSNIARSLFDIVNIIVQRMISDKKQIDKMYKQLPQEKITGIENRDNNSS